LAPDLHRDARRLRWGLVLAALALLACMAVAAYTALSPGWRRVQAGISAYRSEVDQTELGIQQVDDCAGRVDRCTTCHLRAGGPGRPEPDIPQPYRAHPPGPACRSTGTQGCGLCHGGTPRALDAAVAHGLPGGADRDPLMKAPYFQAACGRCHVPGAVPGSERLASGAMRYLQLGCPVCHPLVAGGKGGAAFGPDLRATGRRSLAYLTDSLVDPTANFEGSSMPSFRRTFADHPGALTDLLIFLQSLELAPVPTCASPGGVAGLVDSPCAQCHAGPGGKASGRLKHACTYLIERSDQLACVGCHPGSIPGKGDSGGYCPVVGQHRPACAACHRSSWARPWSGG